MKKEIIKSAVLFAVFEIFLLAVFVLQNSAFALFAFFVFLFLAAASFETAFAVKNKITAKAVLPPTAEKGKDFAGKIILENGSAFPVFKAHCEVLVKNNLTGEENTVNICLRAMPKSKFRFGFAFRHCGKADVHFVFLSGKVVFHQNFAMRFKNRKSRAVF